MDSLLGAHLFNCESYETPLDQSRVSFSRIAFKQPKAFLHFPPEMFNTYILLTMKKAYYGEKIKCTMIKKNVFILLKLTERIFMGSGK